MIRSLLVSFIFALSSAQALEVRGFTLNETQLYPFDASESAATPAQKAVDRIRNLGARHIILSPFARMTSADSNTVLPFTPPGAVRVQERERYLRLIRYIHAQGMTVGLRPLLTLNSNGQSWHGNIRPSNPAAWFESFRSYLDIYANIARAGAVEEFTLGAELYSMTVGIEDQWPQQPYGFPREWLQLSRDLRAKLGARVRLMYDIHFADSKLGGEDMESGGELERWRYRLADLKPGSAASATQALSNPNAWAVLRDLWLSFDAIGIDVYRSLLNHNDVVPQDYNALVARLSQRATHYAQDIDAKLNDIEQAVGAQPRIIIKEVGYRSCTRCFVDPFSQPIAHAELNELHQAAAYQAFLDAFVRPHWNWLAGIVFWEVSTDPARQGPSDSGFSPLGKAHTEQVIRAGWDL